MTTQQTNRSEYEEATNEWFDNTANRYEIPYTPQWFEAESIRLASYNYYQGLYEEYWWHFRESARIFGCKDMEDIPLITEAEAEERMRDAWPSELLDDTEVYSRAISYRMAA